MKIADATMTYSQLPQQILIKLTNLACGCNNDYPATDYTFSEKRDDDGSLRYTDVFLDNDWYSERVRFFDRTGDIIRIHKNGLNTNRLYNLWHIFALCRQMGLTYAHAEFSEEA